MKETIDFGDVVVGSCSSANLRLISEVVVRSGSSVNLRLISEKGPFRLDQIVLPEDVGRNFLITDLKVGKNSQFVSCGAIPASFFVEGIGDGRSLVADVLGRGAWITLSVTNMRGEDRVFKGKLVGEVDISESYEARASSSIGRLVVVGLGHTEVPAGQTAHVAVQVQVPTRVDGLVLPPGSLNGMSVLELRLMGKNVLPEGGLRSERLSFGPVLVRVGDWIVVVLKNDDPPVALPRPAPATSVEAVRAAGFWSSFKRWRSRKKVTPVVRSPALVVTPPRYFSGALVGELVVNGDEYLGPCP